MFVEERTRPVVAEVCRLLGSPSDRPVLLRHHTNAVYAVDHVVIKIAPPAIDIGRLRTVVGLVTWLTARNFPTVRLAPGLDQPLQVNGHAVTVWERLDGAPVKVVELGELLHQLHALPPPPIRLPDLEPLNGIRRSIASSAFLTDDDRRLLGERFAAHADIWNAHPMPLGWGLVQSDPQIRNALRRGDGMPVLADWDGACRGPRMWDLATVAVHCRRFRIAGSFDHFTAAYGCDPRQWDGFEQLCRLRELQMIATNARKSRPGSPACREVQRRIAGLREGPEELTTWNIL